MKPLFRTLLLAALPYLIKMLVQKLSEPRRVGTTASPARRRFADEYAAIEPQKNS